jgi:hypothetical protein
MFGYFTGFRKLLPTLVGALYYALLGVGFEESTDQNSFRITAVTNGLGAAAPAKPRAQGD